MINNDNNDNNDDNDDNNAREIGRKDQLSATGREVARRQDVDLNSLSPPYYNMYVCVYIYIYIHYIYIYVYICVCIYIYIYV